MKSQENTKSPLFSIVLAVAQNNAIGKDNQLLCHISNDLKRFKAITLGHSIIMGKNTLFSLPKGPLPKRRNIILSSTMKDCFDGRCEIAVSMQDALEKVQSEDEVFVIGGAKVFEQFLPLCDKLYLTVLEKDFEADTFISPINFDDFSLVEKEVITDDTSVDFVYRYETWVRK